MNSAWSGFMYQKPNAPVSTRAKMFPGDILGSDEGTASWRVYKQPGDGHNVSERSYSTVMTASENAKLFRIVHESILVYCGNRGKVRAQSLLDVYERYIGWKDDLPHVIQDLANEPLPHVLFLQ